MSKFLLIPIICLSTLLHAQVYDTNKYGPSSQIRFSAMPALYTNLDYHNVGAPWYRSSPGIGGEFVVSFGQAIWKGFGMNVGAGFGLVPYNFSNDIFWVPGSAFEEDDFPLGSFPNRNVEFIITCPILVEKKFLLVPEDRLFLNLEAGIKWNIGGNSFTTSGGSYGAGFNGGESITYFEYEFRRPIQMEFLSYVFKAGLLKVNKRNNTFNWNLVLQHSPSSMLDGTYQFTNLGAESFGTTELHNSYIGVEMIYGLSLGAKVKNPRTGY